MIIIIIINPDSLDSWKQLDIMSSRWHNNQLTPNISLASGNPWASSGWVPKLRRKVERGESWQWNFQPPVVVWIFPSWPFIFPKYAAHASGNCIFLMNKKIPSHHFTSKDVRYGFDSPVPLWQRGWKYGESQRNSWGASNMVPIMFLAFMSMFFIWVWSGSNILWFKKTWYCTTPKMQLSIFEMMNFFKSPCSGGSKTICRDQPLWQQHICSLKRSSKGQYQSMLANSELCLQSTAVLISKHACKQRTVSTVYSCTNLRPFFQQKADWIKSFPSSTYVTMSCILNTAAGINS